MPRKSHYPEHRKTVLVAIGQAEKAHGRAPSIRELADLCGVGVATVHLYIKNLADEGLVEWKQESHRSLRLSQTAIQQLSSLGLL